MTRLIIGLVTAATVLTGCTTAESQTELHNLTKVEVDGTTCVVWVGDNRRGGISCDWGE